MPRSYDEIFADDAPPYPPRPATNGTETRRFSFRQMSSDISAIRKAEKAFAKQHERLAKDGWSEQEIEQLLADYGESWATGMLQERANARPALRAYNLCDLPDDGRGRFCGGWDGVGFWLYDLSQEDLACHGEPRRLFRVGGALAAMQIGPRINRAGATELSDQLEILSEIHAELSAKFGPAVFEEKYRP